MATTASTVEQELLELERRAWQAALEGDYAFSERYMADEALLVSEEGIMDKQSILKMMREHQGEMLSYDLSDMRVVEINEDAAAVTCLVSFDYNDEQGQRQTWRMYNTDVFTRRGDEWVVVFSQMTPIQSSA